MLFYFSGTANISDLSNTNSQLNYQLKKAIREVSYKLIYSFELEGEHGLEYKDELSDTLQTINGDVSWRDLLPLPLEQHKGLLHYWLNVSFQTGSHIWAHTIFCWQCFWDAAEYYSAQTGCALLIEDYENRQRLSV